MAWDSTSGSPDEDINANLDTLRERSKDLYMGGSNVATGILRTMQTNVIGSGLTLKPDIDSKFLKMTEQEAENWRQNVVREFEYFATSSNCDMFRLKNFYEMQQLAFLSMLMSGDVFIMLPHKERHNFPYNLRIQLIEADRVKTPFDKETNKNINQGVERKNGEVVAYHILKEYPSALEYAESYKRIEAFGASTGRRNILHLMESERPDQTRGVPLLAPVIESLIMLGRYTQAELMAALVSSKFTVFIKSENPETDPGHMMARNEQIDALNPHTLELGNGLKNNLLPGEDIEIANPGRPNVAFDNFVTSLIRQIGTAVGMPYEVIVMQFTNSYSASRAANLVAWKMFMKRRVMFAASFCQPIYEEWLSEAVARGRISAPGFFDDPIIRSAYCKAQWHGPTKGELDQYKSAKAIEILLAQGLTTREREAAEMTGTDFYANHRQLAKEAAMQKELEDIIKGGDNGGK